MKVLIKLFQKFAGCRGRVPQKTNVSAPQNPPFYNDILRLSKMHNYLRHVFQNFLTHSFCNEKKYKKSSKLNIYKSKIMRYNISAVGGTNTTASRTTAIVSDKVSSL